MLLRKLLKSLLPTLFAITTFGIMFPADIFPVTLKLVPIAAPIFGVVNTGLVDLTKLPDPVPVYSEFVK
jgi:hypothetical protein